MASGGVSARGGRKASSSSPYLPLSFQMGSPPSETGRYEDEGPQHRVCLKDFKLSRFETTVGDFRAFVAATGYRTDAERNLLLVKGPVPGPRNALVVVRKA